MSNNVVIIVADDVPVGTVVAVAKRADSQVRAVVAGSRELAESVAGAGVASVCWVPQPEGVPTEALASVVAQKVQQLAPAVTLAPNAAASRVLAGAVAAALDAAVASSVVAVNFEDGKTVVERLVAEDASIKGIWCVPKYSNPTGVTYSDDVVRRLAAMDAAAPDFRIFWDNAYAVHHFSADAAEQDTVLDIATACREAGNPDRYLKFGSTSKITFPGAGVAAVAASPANVAEIKRHMNAQAIGHDKLNQLRHARFLDEGRRLAAHMARHGELMAPKFDLVCRRLDEELGEAGIATWTNPRGGYFVSFEGPEGTARRIVALAKEAGVTMTGAGATWPYGDDPADSNIRIAPSLPPLEELDAAMDVFCCCVKLAALERLVAA